MRGPAELTIAVANMADPADPSAFSGAPASLLRGLREAGFRAVALPGALPQPWERHAQRAAIVGRLRPRDLRDLRRAIARERHPAQLGGAMQAVHDARLRAGLRRLGGVDGVIQYGSEVVLPDGVRYVTYEDATLALARRHWAWPHLDGALAGDLARYERRTARVYAGARACCAMSRWAADSMRDDYGVPAERVHVVGAGAGRRPRPPAARDWSVPRFLFVGFDWERKNGPAVVRGLGRVRERHPDATLDVVGGHPPIDAPGVIGHGPIPLGDPEGERRLQGLFERATCFVLPSLHEPAGQAYLEAGSAGIPSIGTADGGAATIVGPGGVVVDPRDDAAVSAAMLDLADPGRAEELGALAEAHAALLTWRKVAERLVRALAPPGVDVERLAPFL